MRTILKLKKEKKGLQGWLQWSWKEHFKEKYRREIKIITRTQTSNSKGKWKNQIVCLPSGDRKDDKIRKYEKEINRRRWIRRRRRKEEGEDEEEIRTRKTREKANSIFPFHVLQNDVVGKTIQDVNEKEMNAWRKKHGVKNVKWRNEMSSDRVIAEGQIMQNLDLLNKFFVFSPTCSIVWHFLNCLIELKWRLWKLTMNDTYLKFQNS